MYWQHFGLSGPIAGQGIARDGRVFTAAQPDVLARLPAALQTTRNAVVSLCGPAGVGKTTLAAHAAREHCTRLELGWLGQAPLTPEELLEHLLVEFGFTPFRLSRAERAQMWRAHLTEMAMTDTLVCILVERAEQLGDDVLQALESLTAADPNGCPGAHLVMMSREPLNARLASTPALEGLAQRIRASLTLTPFDYGATHAYLEFAFAACGGELSNSVDNAAVAALHAHSGGLARRIDTLTESALAAAAAAGRATLDAATVDAVAAELGGTPAAPAAPATAAEPDAAAPPAPPATDLAAPTDTDAVPSTYADDDLPVLTDSVEIIADPLLSDIASEERWRAACRMGAATESAEQSPETAAPAPDDSETEIDALRALANAHALEDISNSMAETLFGDTEREFLRDTLAIPARSDRRARSGTG